MTIDEFMKKVFDKKAKESKTDEIFRFIESDRELLYDYLKLIETNNLKTLNSSVAKAIKKEFGLKEPSIEVVNPKSMLIQSYHLFKE